MDVSCPISKVRQISVQPSLSQFTGVSPKKIFSHPKILKRKFPSKKKYNYAQTNPDKLAGIYFPGRHKPKENCGKPVATYVCKCGHTHKVILGNCNRISCPVCYQQTIKRSSIRATERFIQIRKAYIRENRTLSFAHFSLNTMWDIQNPDDYKFYKKKLLKILKQEGMSGILIFHAWRIRDKFSMRVFPHFHFIGSGKLMNSDLFYEKYGFTYKKIRTCNSPKSLFRAVRYVLSHCGVINHRHTITWNNKFAYNMLSKIETKTEKIPQCEKCESFLYQIIDKPEVSGGLYKKTKVAFNINYKLNFEKILKIPITIYKLKMRHKKPTKSDIKIIHEKFKKMKRSRLNEMS